MTNTVLVTPANWFELQRLAAEADRTGATLELTLTDADGVCPIAAVAIDELRAIHQTLGAWWPLLGGDQRPASVQPGAYDRFLASTRALLKEKAEAALAASPRGDTAAAARVGFPGLDDALLADSPSAIALFRSFLAAPHSPSLAGWAGERASADAAVADCSARPWLRLVLQKAAADEQLPEAFACLRQVYAGGDVARRELLADETRLLDACGIAGLHGWARSLGLDRPTRVDLGIDVPRARAARSGAAPELTVLLPSYRHEDFVDAALESVFAQTYTSYRVLVVDDRSPDRTVERASRHRDPRLDVAVNDANLGLGDSILRALDRITTPLVAVLNSDDLFHPERLERCVAVLDTSPAVQVVATGIVPIDGAGRLLSANNVRRLFDGSDVTNWLRWFDDACDVEDGSDLLLELMQRNFLITSSNIVCRTSFLRSRGEALHGLKYCFDWQVFLEAALARSLAYIRDELVGYRLHASNTVWFDEERRVAFKTEVNRVLARTWRRLLGPDSPMDADQAARVLERMTLQVAPPPDTDRGPGGGVTTAMRIIAEASLEEAAIARGSERWMRHHLDDKDKAFRVELEAEKARAAEAERRAQAELDARRDVERQLETAMARAHAQIAGLTEEQSRQAGEIARLRASPEWRVGDLLWNKARLSGIGARATYGLRSLRDRRNRRRLAAGARPRGGASRPRVVVAACWSFPMASQTFVYQEIQGLEWAGFDYRLFCCETNDKRDLPAAFENLWDRRFVLQTEWAFNQRDLEHFRRTRPDRVETLLARLGDATGLSADALLRESIVMMGFSFARHVELSGAEYLHTYFFYDQSFMAMMAAWLLGIPRGVTAYADHMLKDYAFKLVPLQLELADIVVATSRRIGTELGEIGGARVAAKILVKPNGIDTARFPFIDAAARLEAGGDPELISVSRIEPKKGLLDLIDAVGILKARGVPVRLGIVGGVDRHTPTSVAYSQALAARIEERGIADRVTLHGAMQQHEFLPLLSRARLFVAPYIEVPSGDKDGIPTALLEAMSTGLPIVATNAGSILEAVTDGAEAVIVPQHDPSRLADAIERLLGDRTFYARMVDAARHRALSEFDAHVTERSLHDRIHALLATGKRP